MRSLVAASIALAATVALSAPAPASAALVAPGETNPAVNIDANDYAVPSGDVVAPNSQNFVIEYDLASIGFTAEPSAQAHGSAAPGEGDEAEPDARGQRDDHKSIDTSTNPHARTRCPSFSRAVQNGQESPDKPINMIETT